MTRMAKKCGRSFSFGQSKAKILIGEKETQFSDVAGAYEAKEELTEIVDFLKNPKNTSKLERKFQEEHCLLVLPERGKPFWLVLLREANAPFFSISGSEFVEMFVGVGASRVRDLLKRRKKCTGNYLHRRN